MAKSLLDLSHCFMLQACHFIPENSPLTHRYPVLVYVRVSLTTRSRVNGCSSFSPHSFAVLRLTWLEQTPLYSLILELQIDTQTVRGVLNMRKLRAVIRSVYFHRVQCITGSQRHPIACYWERAIGYFTSHVVSHSLIPSQAATLAQNSCFH